MHNYLVIVLSEIQYYFDPTVKINFRALQAMSSSKIGHTIGQPAYSFYIYIDLMSLKMST